MPIMAKSNDEYTEVKAIKTPNGTEIDYVLSKVDNTYKRTYTATRELEDTPPLEFKSIKPQANLLDYRIYGQTVDGESVGDLVTSGEHAGEYKVVVTVEGKNLLQNTATSQTKNGVTFTVNADKSITCNGTATNNIFFVVKGDVVLESGTYVLTGCPLGGGKNTFRLYAQTDGGAIFYMDDGAGAIINYTSKIEVLIAIYSGQVCNNLIFYPMIREADIEDDTYEPYHAPVTTPIYLPEQIKKVGDEAEYIDYGLQKQHRVRKNLLQNTAISQTINGVTFTVNSDGSVTCNGKCVNNVAVLYIKRPTTFYDETIQYTLTGCPVGGAYNSTYALEYTNSVNQSKPDVGNGVSFTPYRKEFYPNACIRIVIFVGYTCDNLTFYPMIRKASITDDTYEPYIENTDLDVTLPALPTLAGTNVLSVGTEVQPSDVYIKGNFKMIAGGGE